MANNTQIGKYLYSNTDLPLYGKVLSVINESKSGASFVTISGKQEIVQEFNGDIVRTQGKVKTVLSNLRFRGVANEVNVSHGHNVWRIANKDDALTLIAEAGKLVNKMTQRATDVAAVKSDSVDNEVTNTPKTKKVNTMATKTVSKKAPRLFVNPETSKVEPFGAGRPSKAKLAFECNADGQYLNPQAAMQFAQQGGKSEDKLTKAELLDLLRKVRAERDEAIAARDTLAEVLGELNKGEVEASADEGSEDEACDELDLDAEAVEGDEESDEVEAADAE